MTSIFASQIYWHMIYFFDFLFQLHADIYVLNRLAAAQGLKEHTPKWQFSNPKNRFDQFYLFLINFINWPEKLDLKFKNILASQIPGEARGGGGRRASTRRCLFLARFCSGVRPRRHRHRLLIFRSVRFIFFPRPKHFFLSLGSNPGSFRNILISDP